MCWYSSMIGPLVLSLQSAPGLFLSHLPPSSLPSHPCCSPPHYPGSCLHSNYLYLNRNGHPIYWLGQPLKSNVDDLAILPDLLKPLFDAPYRDPISSQSALKTNELKKGRWLSWWLILLPILIFGLSTSASASFFSSKNIVRWHGLNVFTEEPLVALQL